MSEPLINITSEKIAGEVMEVRIEGCLDFSNSDRLEQALEQVFQKGIYKVVVDFKDTQYISSRGIGCLIGCIDTSLKNGGEVIFSSTPAEIKETFDIVGFTRIVRFAANREEALKLLSEVKQA